VDSASPSGVQNDIMANGQTASIAIPATDDTASRWARLTLTERNFLKSLVYTAAIVFVFYCGFLLEREILNRSPAAIRFIPQAAEAAMRYVGIPHVIIGFLFMTSSPRNRTWRKRSWLAGLFMVGIALCTGYYVGGGKTNLILYTGVYLYFLVHELRDEANFVFILGDAPPPSDRAAMQGLVTWMTGLIVVSMIVLGVAPASFGVFHEKLSAPGSALAGGALVNSVWIRGALPLGLKLLIALAPMVLLGGAYVAVLRRSARRLGFSGAGQLMSTYHTMFRIMFGVAGVLGLALIVTQRAYPLALFHFVAWYVFASYQFDRNPPKQDPTGRWLWMRTTVSGFKTLHIGLVLALMAVGLYWTLALDPTDTSSWLTKLIAPAAFPYWTVMHITISFIPK